jgi:hypothetical protein
MHAFEYLKVTRAKEVQQGQETQQSNSVGKISGGKIASITVVSFEDDRSFQPTRWPRNHPNQEKVKMSQKQKEISLIC